MLGLSGLPCYHGEESISSLIVLTSKRILVYSLVYIVLVTKDRLKEIEVKGQTKKRIILKRESFVYL